MIDIKGLIETRLRAYDPLIDLSENGFENQEASALKSSTGWLPSSGNGINAIGFNGLPNGYINAFGGPTLGQGICTWATTNVNTDLPLGSRTRVLVQLFKIWMQVLQDM